MERAGYHPRKVLVSVETEDGTWVWIYNPDEEDTMRDVVVEQVEEDRLHPYVGVMALHAMRDTYEH